MSVKTDAVGYSPVIAKIIDASAEDYRKFAATEMLSRLLVSSTASSGPSAAGNRDANSGEEQEPPNYQECRDRIREIREGMTKPRDLPKEDQGVYADLSEGNIIERYKKGALDREMQMEGESTLAFAKENALKRHGKTEEEKKEFFADYLNMESEYLVAGALLTCSQAQEEEVCLLEYEGAPANSVQDVYRGAKSETEMPLSNIYNTSTNGKAPYARVTDTKVMDAKKNVLCPNGFMRYLTECKSRSRV